MDFKIPAAKDPSSLKRKSNEDNQQTDHFPSKKTAHPPVDNLDEFISSVENVNVSTDALGMKRMVVKLQKGFFWLFLILSYFI
jgi:hypothetical protein